MRARILGGTHGNEKFGIEVCRELKKHPRQNLHERIANPKAVALGIRYIEKEMMSAYTRKDPAQPWLYEETEAEQIASEADEYDINIDEHDNPEVGLDYVLLSPNFSNPLLVRAAGFLGFNKVLLADSEYLRVVPTGMCLDHSLANKDRATYGRYRREHINRLTELATYAALKDLPEAKDMAFYQRAGYVMAGDPREAELTKVPVAAAFEELPESVAEMLGFSQPLYPTGWNYRNQSEGRVFASVAIRVPNPFL